MEKINQTLRKLAILLIVGYQRFISPLLGANCRFQPTCSQYSITAINEYGLIKGVWYSLHRISRCHPLNPGGYDPIPPKTEKN